MDAEPLTPSRAAYRITHILNAVSPIHGDHRFPVDVATVAKECAHIFRWADPITRVEPASIPNFEGALFPNAEKSEWMLLYNNTIRSPGRIRFTQAHELGHYLLHRTKRENFQCGMDDVINRSDEDVSIEVQADRFASTLLMPLDDFRAQTPNRIDLDVLGAASDRYGVSLLATMLTWLKWAECSALMVVHRDGFMRWAYSSKLAMKNGAFFRTKGVAAPIPEQSLAANTGVVHERSGVELAASVWFPHAPADASLREMKISSEEYDLVVTLLVLPKGVPVWKPWTDR